MRNGYIIEKYGSYNLRVEGEPSFSKWFPWMKDVRAFAKANKINLTSCHNG